MHKQSPASSVERLGGKMFFKKFELSEIIPISQLVPEKPFIHVHEYEAKPLLVHDPLFKQGTAEHGSVGAF